MAKKQAEDLESQLREIVISTRGISAWQELLRLRADIKRERKEAARVAALERQERQEFLVLLLVCVGIPITGLITMCYFLFFA